MGANCYPSTLCPISCCHIHCQTIYIQTLQMIYMGKGSAFTGYQSAPKRSQAEMHGMHEVFPEAIAYAAVQVSPHRPNHSCNISQTIQAYYGLCFLDGWDTEDRFFKLNVFFDKCIRLFTEDPKDLWVTDTLNFLTRYLYLVLFLLSSFYIDKCLH